MPPIRCRDGANCKRPGCSFLHPGEAGYDKAPVSRSHQNRMKTDGYRDSSYSRSSNRYDSQSRAPDTGWGSRDSSTHSHGQSDLPSGGWGDSSNNTGWGGKPSTPGWGTPAGAGANSGWGATSPIADTWGSTEPSPRRSSAQFEGKSSSRFPPTSPRDKRRPSPARSSSARERDREQHSDRESTRDARSPSRSSRPSPGRDNRESVDAGKRPGTGDRMDIDSVSPASTSRPAALPPTPTASSMPPPPAPLAATAPPLGRAPPPLAKPPSLPPPPIPRPPPVQTPQPPAPISEARVSTTAPAVTPLAQAPKMPTPTIQSPPQRPPTSADSTKNTPSVKDAQEWVRLLDALLQQRRRYEHLVGDIKKLEVLEKRRAMPLSNGKLRDEPGAMLATARTELDQLRTSVQELMQQFASSMKAMQLGPIPSQVVVPGASNPQSASPEFASQILSLENNVSRLQSELEQIQARVTDASNVSAKSKEDVRGAKDMIKRETDDRVRVVSELKSETTAIKTEVAQIKPDVEGLKKDVGGAYRTLGETKQELGKIKVQQDTLQATLQRVERAQGSTDEARYAELKQEVGRLGATSEELRLKIESLKKEEEEKAAEQGGRGEKREREATGDAMEIDEPRPAKRVRLSMVSAADDEFTGEVSNEWLKESYDRLEDYMRMLENEMVQHHTDTREQLEQFADRLGWEEVLYSAQGSGEPATAESVLHAESSRAAQVRSSAPPEVSDERVPIAKQTLPTIDEGGASREERKTLRKDLDAVMEQLLNLWAGKGVWPGIVGKNLAIASGFESLEEVWENAGSRGPVQPGTNGARQVHGRKKDDPDVMALVKSMQADQKSMKTEQKSLKAEQTKMAKRVAELEAESAKLKTEAARAEKENEELRTACEIQQKALEEIGSVLDGAFKSGDAAPHHSQLSHPAPDLRERATVKQIAEFLPLFMEFMNTANPS